MSDKREKIQKAINIEMLILAACGAVFGIGVTYDVPDMALAGMTGGAVMLVVLLITFIVKIMTTKI